MPMPVIMGVIRRRILANFSADPAVLAGFLPSPLCPKLVRGRAVVGVCLIRLEQVRPRGVPAALGLSSENAAHRMAVTWVDADGRAREGVYIPRRDTSSLVNALAGGRLFPGEHHRAEFLVEDDGVEVDLTMRSEDGQATVSLRGGSTSSFHSELFASLNEASEFFRRGSLGYSARKDGRRLDGITLHTASWSVAPMRIDRMQSCFFDQFPATSVAFDCALVMRDIPHEWHSEPDLVLAA